MLMVKRIGDGIVWISNDGHSAQLLMALAFFLILLLRYRLISRLLLSRLESPVS